MEDRSFVAVYASMGEIVFNQISTESTILVGEIKIQFYLPDLGLMAMLNLTGGQWQTIDQFCLIIYFN